MTEIPAKMWVMDVSRCAVTNCKADNRHALPRATSWAVSGHFVIPVCDPPIRVPFTIPLCDECRKLVVD
jgi:hypothetical protein